MNYDLILQNVAKHITLNETEKTFFISVLEYKVFKRKEKFLNEGEVCRHTAFVIDGALKGFTMDKDGNEHILNFALRDWWIADMYSLISGKRGTQNIEAIADTEVFLMSRDNQEKLYKKVPKFERFFRILVENSLVSNQQRLVDNLSATAQERYLYFIQKYPAIPACVPQHSIASYLGITPEFLSKIRARLATGKE